MRETEPVKRLLRVPAVLAFTGLWGLGSYALGFAVLDNSFPWALAAAFAGGVVVAASLGALVGRPGPVLLGIAGALGDAATVRRFHRHMAS
ncbi:hypothetical protein ACPPVO_39795 [Dactylosporangium sp. McL0621]|uniref:hypothetical protein n=1 Tax=Dactylosporangium sp. McL0621 TaxID=3415678 RepID=UPI003CE8898C